MRRTRPTLYEVDKRSAGLRTARGATMGSMSAPDSGRLPRLGDIFFDVRGGSRSMRVSWFADTGVAVFSIWQGGTCTGTFRLPIDDVSRLVDSLRRGVAGRPRDLRRAARRARWRSAASAPGWRSAPPPLSRSPA